MDRMSELSGCDMNKDEEGEAQDTVSPLNLDTSPGPGPISSRHHVYTSVRSYHIGVTLQLPSTRFTLIHTLRARLSGTFLQTLTDLGTPLMGHSLSPRSCPPTRSAPSERFGGKIQDCGSSQAPKHARKHEAHPPRGPPPPPPR